ncbi:PHP domain-containing protein [bacterium]|nr:PHP domain-containing protein [bacterium]
MTIDDTPQWVDLHLHTNVSDGTLSPGELVDLAVSQNFKTIAITDHDTIDGLKDGINEGVRKKLGVIAGIEISSKYSNGTQHILGFGIDISNPRFLDSLHQFQFVRKKRNINIIIKLQLLGIDISVAEMTNDYPMIHSLGRPHIASILVKKGVVKTMNDAFTQYLGKNGKAFVGKDVLTAAETIRLIHDVGGIAILAHPSTLNLSGRLLVDQIEMLITHGLDGIEVYSSAHEHEQIQLYRSICIKNDLLISAGSDFHGSNKKNVAFGICNNGNKVTTEMVSKRLIDLSITRLSEERATDREFNNHHTL